jgi:hypothetical protein
MLPVVDLAYSNSAKKKKKNDLGYSRGLKL